MRLFSLLFLSTALFALFSLPLKAAGIIGPDPFVPGYYPLEKDVTPKNPLKNPSAIILKPKASSLVSDTQTIDFENRQVTFEKRDNFGNVIWQYRYAELDDYIQSRRNFATQNAWFTLNATPKSGAGQSRNRNFSLELEIPVQYPTWAKRILGKDPPKLAIHGFEELIFGGEKNTRTLGKADAVTSGNPIFENKYELSVTGSVGRLINVTLKTNNTEDLAFNNPLKDIKLEYKGEGNELEDDVIQEVTAGYTSFSIPSTRLSGYSASQQGLFGLSVKSKLGPVTLTNIISSQQAQNLADTFALSGSTTTTGADSSNKETSFSPYKFYFLDTLFQNHYRKNYLAFRNGEIPPDPKVSITIYSVWLVDNSSKESQVKGATYARFNNIQYRKLDDRINNEFTIDLKQGWIRFDKFVPSDESEVGIAFTSSDPAVVPSRGDVSTGGSGPWMFKNIFTRSSDVTDEGYMLMWKNVYKLSGSYDPGFKVDVVRLAQEGESEQRTSTSKGLDLAQLLGLTNSNKLPIIGQYNINPTLGYFILPPYAATPEGDRPFTNPELDLKLPDMYTKNHTSLDFLSFPKYSFRFTGTSTTTTDGQYRRNLGYDILPSSVKVQTYPTKIELVENIDYRMSYETGDLELISMQAKAAEKIISTYQREGFDPDKKTFIGSRAELKLPGIGKSSLVGASILFQNSALGGTKIPRVGQEPYNKLLLDINTSFDFEPEWMTKAVNSIPLITTEATSSLKLDFEIAHSILTPNKSDNNKNGEAYIDDFESSKQVFTFLTSTTSWYTGSPPVPTDSLLIYPPAWKSYWFETPSDGSDKIHRVRKDEIDSLTAPEIKKLSATTGTSSNLYESVLWWSTQPTSQNLINHYQKPWSSIMAWVPQSYKDKTLDKYFEFYVNITNAKGTKLFVDLGEVSEDICIAGAKPNGTVNKEDTSLTTTMTFNLNTGLDNILDDKQEVMLIPNVSATGYDTLKYDNPNLPDRMDPSFDNWKAYNVSESHKNFESVSKLQGNVEPQNISTIYPNTEDINGDGWKKQENFFRFTINLNNPDSTSFVSADSRANDTANWYLIRIPLNRDSSKTKDTLFSPMQRYYHGAPSWSNIRFVRLSHTNFDSAKKTDTLSLKFTRMQFVGNQWESQPSDSGYKDFISIRAGNNKIEVSTLNSESSTDFKDAVDSLPSTILLREKDASTNTNKAVQTLRLDFINLEKNKSAVARKSLASYQNVNLSSYKKISMLVYGKNGTSQSDGLFFVFRFGTSDSTYYEYKTPLKRGWNVLGEWNHPIEIDLATLAIQKLNFLEKNPAYSSVNFAYSPKDGDTIRIFSRNRTLPSFSSINQLALGVVRNNDGEALSNGEFWVDEIKAGGIQTVSGTAAIISLQTKWADFATLNSNLDYRDGNFRTMTDQGVLPSDSWVTAGLEGSLKLDKFIPSQWLVSMPLTGSVSTSLKRPQFRPGTDIALTRQPGVPDKLPDMYKDALNNVLGLTKETSGTSNSSHYQTSTTTRAITTSLKKGDESDNILTSLTLERLSLDNFSYNYSQSKTSQGKTPQGNTDYVETATNKSYGTGLSYDLSPRNIGDKGKWRPFEKDTIAWLPESFKRYELTLLPTRFSFNLANANYSTNQKEGGRFNINENTTNLSVGHGFNFDWAPISPLLSFNYALTSSRNLGRFADGGISKWKFFDNAIFSQDPVLGTFGYLQGEDTRSQNTTIKLNPQILSWLTHDVTYTSNFTGTPNRNQIATKLSLKTTNGFELTSSLQLRDMLREAQTSLVKSAPLTNTFKFAGELLDKVNFTSVSFTYNATLDINNGNYTPAYLNTNGIGMPQLFLYSLGFQKNRSFGSIFTGTLANQDAFGGMESRYASDEKTNWGGDVASTTQSYTLSTSTFSIPKPISLDLTRISLGYSKTYKITADTTAPLDTSIAFPKFNIDGSTPILNELGFIKDNFESPTLNSSYSYSKSSTSNFTRASALKSEHLLSTGYDIRSDFKPLVKFTTTIKAIPITFSSDFNYATTENKNAITKKVTKGKENSVSLNSTYTIEKTGGIRDFKILRWTISMKGRIAMGAEMQIGSKQQDETTEVTLLEDEKPTKVTDEKNLSLTPHVGYDFTDNVTANIAFSWVRLEKLIESLTTSDASLRISIKLTF